MGLSIVVAESKLPVHLNRPSLIEQIAYGLVYLWFQYNLFEYSLIANKSLDLHKTEGDRSDRPLSLV